MSSYLRFSSTTTTYQNSWLYFAFSQEKTEKIFTQLVSNFIGDLQFQNFLEAILKAFPDLEQYVDLSWTIISALKEYKDVKDDFSIKFALNDFKNLKTDYAMALQPLLDKPDFQEQMAQPICFFLLMFRDSYPGLFYTLMPKLEPIITKLGIEKMYTAFGPESLSFIVNTDYEFFQKLDVDPKSFVLFFKYPIAYTDKQFIPFFQEKFAMKKPETSFVETLIVNQRHFLDYFDPIFLKYLKGNNYSKLSPEMEFFKKAIPIFIVQHYKEVLENENAAQLLGMNYSDSFAINSIQRMINDYDLLNSIKFYTQNELTADEFMKNSIAYHLQYSLGTPQVLDLANKPYFMTSDKDRNRDFDVIRGYIIFRLFLTAFRNPTKQLKQVIHNIEVNLNLLTPAFRDSVSLDLFSLIFIQDKKQQGYICHPKVAKKLVEMLLKFVPNLPQLLQADSILSSIKLKKNEHRQISTYLNRDLNQIYYDIEAGKWDSADEKTKFLPYYRKFYTKAYVVYLLSHDQQIPETLESEKDNVRLNLACSYLNKGEIKEMIEKYNQYANILIPRKNASSPDSLMGSLKGKIQWSDAMASAYAIDQSPLEQIGNSKVTMHIKNITNSKNLLKFISDTFLYFESASLYPNTDGSLENVFQFDMRKALAGPFNIGDEKKTKQLAEIFHVDLYPFIISNLDWFQITDSFVKNLMNVFPVVAEVLAIQYRFYNVINESDFVSKEIKKYVSTSTVFDDSMKPRLITLLKEDKIEDIEDLIYNVDHVDLYNSLINETDHKYFTDSLIYALDICDYVAPEGDAGMLKKIRIYYKVSKITKEKDPIHVVADIYNYRNENSTPSNANDDENKSENFDLAVDYIKVCIDEDERGPPIVILFQLSLGNGDQMLTILREFNERFDLISSRFFHVEGVVPYLIKGCPKSKEDEIRTLTLLPEIISQDSNIFDLSTVIEAFARHPECIFTINNETVTLFTDDDLRTMLHLLKENPIYKRVFAAIYKLLRNKDEFTQKWIEEVESLISGISVKSIQDESRCNLTFRRKILPYIKVFDNYDSDPKFKWIKCAYSFASSVPYSRFKISYDFGELLKDKYSFAKLCSQIDRLDISKSLDINTKPIVLDYYTRMITLGQYSIVEKLVNKNHDIFFDEFDKGLVYYDNSYLPFISFTHNKVFDMTIPNALANKVPIPRNENVGMLFIYQQIKVISLSMTKMPVKHEPFYNFLIKNTVSKPHSLSFLVTYKTYEEAFDYLDTKTGEERNELFLDYFFFPAICNNTINTLEKYILNSKGEEYSSFIWNQSLSFFESRNCRNTMYKINMNLKNWEAAADACFRLFDNEDDLQQQIKLLGHAIFCLTEALNGQVDDRAALEDKLEKLNFQKSLCQFFDDYGIPNKREYNLMRGETAALALAALFLANGDRDLLLKLNELFHINPKLVAIRVSEDLLEMNDVDKINECRKRIESINPKIKDYVQTALLKKLQSKGNKKIILDLIREWTDPREKCLMLIEYDFIREAMKVAVENKIGEFLPLIAHRASQLGLCNIALKCDKILPSTQPTA